MGEAELSYQGAPTDPARTVKRGGRWQEGRALMTRTRLPLQALAWTAVVLLAAAAGAASAQRTSPGGSAKALLPSQTADDQAKRADASAAPSTMELDVRLTNDTALLLVEQTWVGKSAKDMRQSLDVFFGAADGNLEAHELDAISRATEKDMRNKTVSWLRIDGTSPTIQDVAVSFQDAAGRATDLTSVTMTHEIQATLPAPSTSSERRVDLSPRWNGTLAITAPPGFVVTTGNASETPAAVATVPFVAGSPVSLTVQPRESVSTPTPVAPTTDGATNGTGASNDTNATPTPEESAGGGRAASRIPGPAVALALGAVALAALALGRRRA